MNTTNCETTTDWEILNLNLPHSWLLLVCVFVYVSREWKGTTSCVNMSIPPRRQQLFTLEHFQRHSSAFNLSTCKGTFFYFFLSICSFKKFFLLHFGKAKMVGECSWGAAALWRCCCSFVRRDVKCQCLFGSAPFLVAVFTPGLLKVSLVLPASGSLGGEDEGRTEVEAGWFLGGLSL